MEDRQYFILKGKDKYGPYAFDTLKDIGIDDNTKIWYSGLSKWTKASQLPELSEAFTSPPATASRKKFSIISVVMVLLLAGIFMGYRFLSGSHTASSQQLSSLSNQQLYKMYAPSVVLIQHRYMYQVTAGEKKYYFNDFYGYDDHMGYLVGLTDDSLKAAREAEVLQGTGFFVSKDGKLLTNRHVAKPAPNEDEQYDIQQFFFQSLDGSLASVNFMDSIKRNKLNNDSLLTVLLEDSITNASEIAGIRQKISDAENILEEEDGDEPPLQIDSATIDYLKNQSINIKKINLELKIFLAGTQSLGSGSGINCNMVASSEDENVDLALMQTANKVLPDTSVKIVNLSRVSHSDQDNLLPQMSERLILIGYNRGTELATTTAGIQSQLTDGKVSQNTDAFRLMYTIPTLPGSSGSPVLDDKGRLVSVNFAGMTGTQSFNYGIQPRQIREFLDAQRISQ